MLSQNIDEYVETHGEKQDKSHLSPNANINLDKFLMRPVSSPKKKSTHFSNKPLQSPNKRHMTASLGSSPNRRQTAKPLTQSPQRRHISETPNNSPRRRHTSETPINTPRRRHLSRRASETSMLRVPPKTPHKKRSGGSQVSSPVRRSGHEDEESQTGSGGGEVMPIVNLLPK